MGKGTLLVGVDVSKRVHHVCMVEQHGAQVGCGITFRNAQERLKAFCDRGDRGA